MWLARKKMFPVLDDVAINIMSWLRGRNRDRAVVAYVPEPLSHRLEYAIKNNGQVQGFCWTGEAAEIAESIFAGITNPISFQMIDSRYENDDCAASVMEALARMPDLSSLYYEDDWRYLRHLYAAFQTSKSELFMLALSPGTKGNFVLDTDTLNGLELAAQLPIRHMIEIRQRKFSPRHAFPSPSDLRQILAALRRGLVLRGRKDGKQTNSEDFQPGTEVALVPDQIGDANIFKEFVASVRDTKIVTKLKLEKGSNFDELGSLVTILESTTVDDFRFRKSYSLASLSLFHNDIKHISRSGDSTSPLTGPNTSQLLGKLDSLRNAIEKNTSLKILEFRNFWLPDVSQPNVFSNALFPALETNRSLSVLYLYVDVNDYPSEERILSFWAALCESIASLAGLKELYVEFRCWGRSRRDAGEEYVGLQSRFGNMAEIMIAQAQAAREQNFTLSHLDLSSNFGFGVPQKMRDGSSIQRRNVLYRDAQQFRPSSSNFTKSVVDELVHILHECEKTKDDIARYRQKYLDDANGNGQQNGSNDSVFKPCEQVAEEMILPALYEVVRKYIPHIVPSTFGVLS